MKFVSPTVVERPCPEYSCLLEVSVTRFWETELNKSFQKELARPIEPAKKSTSWKNDWATLKQISPAVRPSVGIVSIFILPKNQISVFNKKQITTPRGTRFYLINPCGTFILYSNTLNPPAWSGCVWVSKIISGLHTLSLVFILLLPV